MSSVYSEAAKVLQNVTQSHSGIKEYTYGNSSNLNDNNKRAIFALVCETLKCKHNNRNLTSSTINLFSFAKDKDVISQIISGSSLAKDIQKVKV